MNTHYTALTGHGAGRRCICAGHGKSADQLFKMDIDSNTDIIAVNTTKYVPFCTYLLVFDDDVLKAVRDGKMLLSPFSKIIGPAGHGCDYQFAFQETPRPHTSRFGHYRSGLRAVFLAADIMQYNEIYLYGYDYHPHPKVETVDLADIRTWESRNLPWDPAQVLDDQLEEFKDRPWPATIFQGNPMSRLQHFPNREYRSKNGL